MRPEPVGQGSPQGEASLCKAVLKDIFIVSVQLICGDLRKFIVRERFRRGKTTSK